MFKSKLFNFLFILIFLVPLAVSGCIFEDDDDEEIAVPIDNPPAETPNDPARISGSETSTGPGTIGGS